MHHSHGRYTASTKHARKHPSTHARQACRHETHACTQDTIRPPSSPYDRLRVHAQAHGTHARTAMFMTPCVYAYISCAARTHAPSAAVRRSTAHTRTRYRSTSDTQNRALPRPADRPSATGSATGGREVSQGMRRAGLGGLPSIELSSLCSYGLYTTRSSCWSPQAFSRRPAHSHAAIIMHGYPRARREGRLGDM